MWCLCVLHLSYFLFKYILLEYLSNLRDFLFMHNSVLWDLVNCKDSMQTACVKVSFKFWLWVFWKGTKVAIGKLITHKGKNVINRCSKLLQLKFWKELLKIGLVVTCSTIHVRKTACWMLTGVIYVWACVIDELHYLFS